MKKIILNALKYFLFLFLVLEIVPYIMNGMRDIKEIVLQTIVLAIFSMAISIFNKRK